MEKAFVKEVLSLSNIRILVFIKYFKISFEATSISALAPNMRDLDVSWKESLLLIPSMQDPWLLDLWSIPLSKFSPSWLSAWPLKLKEKTQRTLLFNASHAAPSAWSNVSRISLSTSEELLMPTKLFQESPSAPVPGTDSCFSSSTAPKFTSPTHLQAFSSLRARLSSHFSTVSPSSWSWSILLETQKNRSFSTY